MFVGKYRNILVYGKNAREAADKLRTARTKQGGIPLHRLTLADWLEQWIEDSRKDGTYTGGTADGYEGVYKKYIVPAIGKVKLSALTANHLRDLLSTLERDGVSAGRRKRVRLVVKASLAEAYMRDLVVGNVADRVRPVKAPTIPRRSISLDAALAFIKAARGDRNEALYLMLLLNGIRESEAFGLYPCDVDREAGVIRINRKLYERKGGLYEEPPKGGKAATVPLAPFLVEPIERYLATRKEAEWPYLFLSERGQRLRRSVFLRKVWHPFREKHGLPYMVPHQLRHTTSTLLKRLGVPIEVRKEILRHASISTTDLHYDDEIPELQRDALSKLSDLLGME